MRYGPRLTICLPIITALLAATTAGAASNTSSNTNPSSIGSPPPQAGTCDSSVSGAAAAGRLPGFDEPTVDIHTFHRITDDGAPHTTTIKTCMQHSSAVSSEDVIVTTLIYLDGGLYDVDVENRAFPLEKYESTTDAR